MTTTLLDRPTCALCDGPPASWKATTRKGDTYLCCSGCKERGTRQRVGIKYVALPDAYAATSEERAEDRIEAEQLTLSGPGPKARPIAQQATARATDPETSHEAARSVKMTDGQVKVLALLDIVGCPLTHEEMVERAPLYGLVLSPSGIRTRCRELADRGDVCEMGEALTNAGRRSRRWGRTVWIGTPKEHQTL